MGDIVLAGSTSGTTTLTPAAVSGTTTLTLPTTNGTVLTNGTNSNFPAGSTLQAIQAIFTGTQTLATGGVNANFSDITSLSVTITPSSSSNKILLIAHLSATVNDDRGIFFKFTGGNTASFVGNTSGNITRVAGFYYSGNSAGSANGAPVTLMYLDSPSTTSAITYKVQGAPNYLSGIAAINYHINETDSAYFPRGASSLIAMEVKG